MEKLSRILAPLLLSSPDMRVVFHPCEPDGEFEDVEYAETVAIDPSTNLASPEGSGRVLVIN